MTKKETFYIRNTETPMLWVYLLPFWAFGEEGCDNYGKLPTGCYNTALFVSTTSGEIFEKSWNGLKSVITLHRQSEQTTPVRTDSTNVL